MSVGLKDGVSDVRRMADGWRWGRRSQVPRSAEPFVPAAQNTVFHTDWARRRPAKIAREAVQKGALEPLFRSQVRTHVEGLDVLARLEGPVIFVANHASHLDTPLILLSLPDGVASPDRRRRGRRLLLRHLVARRRVRRSCSTRSRSSAAAAPWRPRPARCSPTAGAW